MKLINKFVFTILFVLVSVAGFGQQFSITGNILDETNQPIAFANIVLLKALDSTIVTGTTSDDFGTFTINKIDSGNYIIKTSFIGFEDNINGVNVINDVSLGTITLIESVEELSEIQLAYKKPTFKKEADRLVFNVENSALIEGTMLHVIRSTPSVLVLDSGISIKGNSPTVYINDRKVHLSSNELVQFLESASANSIKSVEVITNPSAKYDADSGVVLNIIMSKNIITGYRGSLFSNYTQGVFPRYNAGTSHFFKSSKVNLNLNYSYVNSKINRDNDDAIYFLDQNNDVAEIWKSKINRNTWSETHNLNFNFDYDINAKNTLSLSSSMLYLPYFKYHITNNTVIADDNLGFLSRFYTNNLSKDNKYNLGFDLDYAHQFNKGKLSFNTHFTTYDYERFQDVFSDFFDQDDAFENSSAFNTSANQATQIYTTKVDFEIPMSENSKFEAGVKYADIQTESDITQFDVDVDSGDEQIDPQNSDAFDYNEKVLSAYSNYSLDTEKWSLSIGLRAEQTNIEGISISTNETNTQDYLEWFPNASILHNITDKFSLYANYKRTIVRPNYTDINPFRFFLNDNYVVVGNPNLIPTYIDHYVIGANLFKKLTVEAYYNNYDGDIIEIPRQNNQTNIVEYIHVNLDKKVEFGFEFLVEFSILENWSSRFASSFYNIEEETRFEEGIVSQDQWSIYSELSNSLSLLKDKSLNVNFTLFFNSKNLQGFQVLEDRLYSDLSISKSILNKNGSIFLSITDIFNKQDFKLSTRYLNQFNTNYYDIDNRTIQLGFRYKFGNTKLQSNERSKENEEIERLN